MKAVLAVLLLAAAPSSAAAFLFGDTSEKKAGDILGLIVAAFDRGDCPAVVDMSGELFGEKPPAAVREEAYSYLGRCYEYQGVPDKAITVYKLAYGLYPENIFFPARLAAIYLRSGFYEAAIPLFEKALKDRPDDIEANAGLARCYASLGFLIKAKTYYSRAAILGDFRDTDLLKEYSGWMLRKRDWEEAELILGYAIKLAPRDARLFEALGRTAAGRGDYRAAAVHLREAVKLDPSDRALPLELALAELLGGDSAAALSSGMVPGGEDNALALLIRGMALQKQGEKALALECFRKASAFNDRPFIAAFAAALLGSGGPAAGR